MDLQSVFFVAIALAVLFAVVAYWMAANGLLMETRFGRVVFGGTLVSTAIWMFITNVSPKALGVLGISDSELELLLGGAVLTASVVAALLDLVGWARGENRAPPPLK